MTRWWSTILVVGVTVACGNVTTATPSPSPTELVRIPLSGDGPIDVEIVGHEAWVLASDSGELLRVDLANHLEIGSLKVGSLPTVLEVSEDRLAFIGDVDGPNGEHLLVADPIRGTVDGIVTGAPSGIAFGLNGSVLSMDRTGLVSQIDPATGATVDRVSVVVDPNEHMDIVDAYGAAWVSSDSQPLTVIAPQPRLVISSTINVGGGIPFVFRDPLIWGARPDEVWAIDIDTNEVEHQVPLHDLIEILALDIADGEAWIAARRPGYVGIVIRLALATGQVEGEWPVSLPASVKVVGDFVWVASYETDELVGIPR